jgi:small GTP-binding protein
MESAQIAQNKEIVHFSKINIFGEFGVGKSTFISWLEEYKNKDFKIKNENDDSFEISKNLVEQVKRIIVPINEDKDIHFLVYETNLNHFDTIRANLDTLLFQTECILVMWDSSHPNTFEKIPDLVNSIISMIKEKQIRNIDIYIVQNRTDLDFDISKEGQTEEEINQKIDELKNIYNNIYKSKTSILKKEGIHDLLLDIYRSIDKEKIDRNDAIDSVKIKYPIKSIENNNNINNQKTLNICLVGEKGAGKSTFIMSLLDEKKEYMENIRKNMDQNLWVDISNEKILVKLSENSDKKNGAYKNYYGFVLFFDVTEKKAINDLNEWINIIKEKVKRDIIIIGNKIDLGDKREIKKAEVKKLAAKNNCKYFECCCLNGINILEIFNEIVFDAYQNFNDENSSKMSSPLKMDEKKNSFIRVPPRRKCPCLI